MRTLIIVAAILAMAAISPAQQTSPVRTTTLPESDTTVGTSWDSTYVGGATVEKSIEIQNNGPATLYYCLNNDTTGTASYHLYHTIAPGQREFIGRAAYVKFVRTKMSTGTYSRRIKVWE